MRTVRRTAPRTARVVVAAMAVTALAATGCATSGGSSDAGTECTSPGVTPTEIKLGMIYPDTGALASPFRYSRSGVDARLGLANAAGGVHGRTVNYEWRDDESDPRVNGESARLLVEQDGVFGLIMPTAVAAGSARYLDDQGVPVVGIAGESVWGDHPNMFAFANLSAPGSSVDTFGQVVLAQGGTRALVVKLATTAASTEVLERVTESLRSQGVEIVGEASYDGPGAGATISRQIRTSGADALVSSLTIEALADVLQATKADGVALKLVLNPVGYTPQALANYGAVLAGVTVYTTYLPFEIASPALDTYHDAMARFAPELNAPDQEFSMMSYITTDVFLRGLEAAGPCPTREGFINALRAITDYDGAGLTPGSIDLSTSSRDLSTCWSFVRVNETGTGFAPLLDATGSPAWCGQRLSTPN